MNETERVHCSIISKEDFVSFADAKSEAKSCPLCPPLPMKLNQLKSHIVAKHVKKAVALGNHYALGCKLQCKGCKNPNPNLHYHCLCGTSYVRRCDFIRHSKKCTTVNPEIKADCTKRSIPKKNQQQ